VFFCKNEFEGERVDEFESKVCVVFFNEFEGRSK